MYILSDWRSRKEDVTLGSNSIEEERHFLSFLSFFFFKAEPRGLWDLISLTTDWTQAPGPRQWKSPYWTAREHLRGIFNLRHFSKSGRRMKWDWGDGNTH